MRIAVLGGAGRMGGWLVRYFTSRGDRVIISDVKLDEAKAFAEKTGVEWAINNAEAVKEVESIVVSTPIHDTAGVIREVVPHAKKGATIIEISSLKLNILEALVEVGSFGMKPLSLHPLFGPGASKLKGRRLVVVPVFDSEAETRWTKELFPEVEIVVVDAEEHDRAMAIILALPHFLNLVFASIVGNEDISTLKRLEGATFKLQLILAESLMMEESALHLDLQMGNKYVSQYLDEFLSRSKTLRDYITHKKKEEFTQLYREVQNSMSRGMDFSEAYRKMYEALDLLQ